MIAAVATVIAAGLVLGAGFYWLSLKVWPKD